MARSAYTYLHLPIVAGVIVFAAGVEQMIAHPADPLRPMTAALIAGGPLLYLLGLLGFRKATQVSGSIPYLAGAAAALLLLLGAPGLLTPVMLGAIVAMCLVAVAISESISSERRVQPVTLKTEPNTGVDDYA